MPFQTSTMAVSTTFTAASFLPLLLLCLAVADANQMMGVTGAQSPIALPPKPALAPAPAPAIDCGAACGSRCRLSSRPNLCKRACGSCCAECHCVPPGTYGNYEACPCYSRLKTHNKVRKCP
ncbi:gibberellin-regulated protein 1-like [Diospyros lotus]|uniref:gibberellin-regulated protein 1-like n=1 Tax=Diospyros lotus TaxID=55363 RepID=UPI002250537C|nr:gibberellin-regulated protein 1-like [Diospyros lotus]